MKEYFNLLIKISTNTISSGIVVTLELLLRITIMAELLVMKFAAVLSKIYLSDNFFGGQPKLGKQEKKRK